MRDRSRLAYEKKLAKVVGQRMRELRRERGWKQVDLEAATDSAVVRSTIGNFESGARLPSFYALSRIAHAFEVPLAYFILDVNASDGEHAAFVLLKSPRNHATAVLALVAEKEPPPYGRGRRHD